MIVKGVDLSALPDQFQGCIQGRTLILDGDGPAYRVAATVKRLDTAIRRFQQDVLTQLFVTRSQDATVHFTASTSHKAGRFQILGKKPYQGNRAGKSKPALLEPLRQAMSVPANWLPEFNVVMHHVLEADDGMIQQAYRLKEHGVIWSDDKDLRMTPYPYYDMARAVVCDSEPFGWLQPKITGSGTVKLVGQGPLFFWAQMLMGDTADNIAGLGKLDGKLCGPATAYEYLRHAKDINEAANLVVDAYRRNEQNPLPEGWLLWLLRWDGDTFWNYLQELELSAANKDFVAAQAATVWFKQESADA